MTENGGLKKGAKYELPDGYVKIRMMMLKLTFLEKHKPRTLWEWLDAIWGYDIFIQNKVPFLKSLVLINVLVWLLFFWKG